MRLTGRFPRGRGFTLIELLIVVAIIAVLAAIAIPNFLEAQTRAKVAKAQGEFYNIGMMLEAYHVDWNWYPADYMPYEYCGWPYWSDIPSTMDILVNLKCLTTPVAYLSSVPYEDPFGDPNLVFLKGRYFYENVGDKDYWWSLCAIGVPDPDPHHELLCPDDHSLALSLRKCYLWVLRSLGPDRGYEWEDVLPYDSSNGTVSRGEVVRVGP